MRRPKKKAAIALAIVLVVGLIVALGDGILSYFGQRQLRFALSEVPDARIEFGSFRLALLPGDVVLKDVEVDTRDTTLISAPGILTQVGEIRLTGIQWLRALMGGDLKVGSLQLKRPRVSVVLPPDDPKSKSDRVPEEEKADSTAPASALKTLSLSKLQIQDGAVHLSGVGSSLCLEASNLGFSLRDLSYRVADSVFTYNQDCYRVSLDSLDFTDEAGLSRIQAGSLRTENAGPIEANDLHMWVPYPKEKLADRMGKVAVMWYDVCLDRLQTSALNLPEMIQGDSIRVDSVRIEGSKAFICQDDRYPPAVPYPTIQEGINTLSKPLQIGCVDARLKEFTFQWVTEHIHNGELPMRNAHIILKSVSNAPDNTMEMFVNLGMGKGSSLALSLWTRNDKKEHIRGKVVAQNLDVSLLDPFLRPLFGITAECQVHHIDGSFSGDKHGTTGELCMLYDGLSVHAWEDSPYQVISSTSGLINFFAPLVLPKSNPVREGAEPKMAKIEVKRDPMVPYPGYLVQMLVSGMKNTLLPGGKVRKK
ncbi:MAG: hypothetical protein J6Y32_03085 [Bacteroidales bacterium]|nr:hypothetical protein [Bacteroidales bacterium]